MKKLNENQRRIVMFAVIVTVGSAMVLFDIPLTLMIPLIIIAGFAILLALGSITVADIREIAASLKPVNLKKIPALKRLDEMKFFDKKSPTAAPASKSGQKPVLPVKPAAAGGEEKPGFMAHMRTFASSLGSLGDVVKRTRRETKVEDINKMLDKTVSEKVSSSALSSAGNVAKPAKAPAGGSGGGKSDLSATADDPFLSLSGDEFDPGLLDGLDDDDMSPPVNSGAGPSPHEGLGSMVGEPEIPMPSMDFASEADDILKDNATPGLEEFSGLDGGDTIDEDFGDLDDLEGLDLDDVSLEGEGTEPAAAIPEPAAAPADAAPAVAAHPSVKEVKMTDWVNSDAPAPGGEDDVSTHADMAAFAGGSGGSDEDLLSSIASDVKHTKKEKDVSLLRELKDFKAPAGEIEHELSGLYDRINAIPRKEKGPEPRAGK